MDEEAPQPLSSKVESWLRKEGYPLEYYVANVFSDHEFRVAQGEYIDDETGLAREVDVLASRMVHRPSQNDLMVRAYNVLECKYIKGKPWVCFTGQRRMMSSASIAQAISSELGESALWANSGRSELNDLSMFNAPERPVFGGRQAFGDNQDRFYSTIRSVTNAAKSLAKRYNVYEAPGGFPRCAVIAFPVVVIDGDLFEAQYDSTNDKMDIKPVSQAKVFWRGEPNSPKTAVIDIVTRDALVAFAEQRKKDIDVLMDILVGTCEEIRGAFFGLDMKKITVYSGSTGLLGRPELYRRMISRSHNNEIE